MSWKDFHHRVGAGVATLNDLRYLPPLEKVDVKAVIVGRALYEGTFMLTQASEIAPTT